MLPESTVKSTHKPLILMIFVRFDHGIAYHCIPSCIASGPHNGETLIDEIPHVRIARHVCVVSQAFDELMVHGPLVRLDTIIHIVYDTIDTSSD